MLANAVVRKADTTRLSVTTRFNTLRRFGDGDEERSRRHSSSTSSGGGHKNCPQASMTCCSLWARTLTLKAYVPMVRSSSLWSSLMSHQRYLLAAVSSRAWPATMSTWWTFLSSALFSQSHTHQDAEPFNDVLV